MASQPISNPGPRLPPEILDYIVDFLHDKDKALKKCSIVSKSWIPRTRKHLFAHIRFENSVDLGAWKNTFPDPSNSPAHHTRHLSVGCLGVVTAADGGEGGWIGSFAKIEELKLWCLTKDWRKLEGPLTLFHNISPALKHLCLEAVTLPPSQVCDLLCSFPRLEDLDVVHDDFYEGTSGEDGAILRSSTSPVLTGTLVLYHRLRQISLRLLNLPNGLRFRRIVCESWVKEDLVWIAALVKACSDTLEVIDVAWWETDNPSKVSVDFSDAMHLKDVSFWFDGHYVPWITEALKTITPNHRYLREIKIYVPFSPPSYDDGPVDVRQIVEEDTYLEWMDLDRILVQLWESHAIRMKVVSREETEKRWRALRDFVGGLLPESTTRGMIEFVDALELNIWGPVAT